jgi:transcriptional regulator with GAF, ATPase, and Fis domain
MNPALFDSFINLLPRLEQQLSQGVGHRYMTVLVYDDDLAEAERVFSSNPAVYPATGRKSFKQAPIMARVRDTGRPYVAMDRPALIRDFPDHETIFAMDCGSLVNLPIRIAGEIVGQINLLHEQHFYTEHKVESALRIVSMTVAEWVSINPTSHSAAK